MPENTSPAVPPAPIPDRFGELAVTMGAVKAEQVSSALEHQASLKSQGQEKRLGDILVERRQLDLRTVQKILLEQQRRRKAATSSAPVPTGKKIGDFELLAKLGEGGMGAVYKARDTQMDRVVALKVMNQNVAGNKEFAERFKREAKATGALNHPNIVAAYGAGEADGRPYLAMELVDGESLRARTKKIGRLPEKEALTIVLKVAQGLGHAHEQGFVHRDIKPDNILLGKDGAVKIVDLGLAKAVDDDQRLTKTGIAIGTPHYISPEQARGEKEIDHRSDIYSLGATLYLLLSGRMPFEGKNNAEIMLKHLKEELENPQDLVPEISDGAVAIVCKMMAKKPSGRYDSCKLLIRDLEQVLAGQELQPAESAGPDVAESSIRPPRRKQRRGARAKASGGGCLVGLLLGMGLLLPALGWLLERLWT